MAAIKAHDGVAGRQPKEAVRGLHQVPHITSGQAVLVVERLELFPIETHQPIRRASKVELAIARRKQLWPADTSGSPWATEKRANASSSYR